MERRGSNVAIRCCNHGQLVPRHKQVPLLKQVISTSGNTRYYPYLVYPTVSLVSSSQTLLPILGFLVYARNGEMLGLRMAMFYWMYLMVESGRAFSKLKGIPFFTEKNSLGLMLNLDWFQPFKHRKYSIGVIYLAIMNLPRAIRFKEKT